MQMVVVAAVLPSLMLMSRTRLYSIFRVGAACFAGHASAGWIAERLFGIPTPVDPIVSSFARHALLIAVSLLRFSLSCRILLTSRR